MLGMFLPAQAGLHFGIQAGLVSPTRGLEDASNSATFGLDLWFKLPFIGVKAEAFWVDVNGEVTEYLDSELLGTGVVTFKNMISADVMFFPLGGLVFLQAGLHKIDVDVEDLEGDLLDNSFGGQLGVGVTLMDKLMIQGKILYTPNALQEDAVDQILGLDDEDMLGYLVTVGWHF
jgi:hypothetical protein